MRDNRKVRTQISSLTIFATIGLVFPVWPKRNIRGTETV